MLEGQTFACLYAGTGARMKKTGKAREEVTDESFPDSVGVGSYRIDLHPSSGGDNYIDVSSLTFRIPFAALIKRVENLLADQKLLADFQRMLTADGMELAWPRVTPR